jgi:TRAP-type C4-dicarboxylate transport system permease small subunit
VSSPITPHHPERRGARAIRCVRTALALALDAVTRPTQVLVLPLSLLLFLQWPLRDWVQAYSRQVNDVAQILFALYVSVAITAATRARTHLASDALAQHYLPATRARLERWAALIVLLPWSVFVLVTAWPSAWRAIIGREAFAETLTPGYFLIRLAVVLLALLVLLRALRDILAPAPGASADPGNPAGDASAHRSALC